MEPFEIEEVKKISFLKRKQKLNPTRNHIEKEKRWSQRHEKKEGLKEKALKVVIFGLLITSLMAGIGSVSAQLQSINSSNGEMAKRYETIQFYAWDSNGSEITNSVTWASSNTTVATINSSGVATCSEVGLTDISATSGSDTDTTDLLCLYYGNETMLDANANEGASAFNLSFNPQDADAPQWFKDATWHLRVFGHRRFPRDEEDESSSYGDWQTIIDEVIIPIHPPWMVISIPWDRDYSSTELNRIQQLQNADIKLIGYLAFPGWYDTETGEKGGSRSEQDLYDKITYMIEDVGLDGVFFDGWVKANPLNPYFNENDQCYIYNLVKSNGAKPDNVLIMMSDIWYVNDTVGTKLDDGETWPIDCLDGVDWEIYSEDFTGANSINKVFRNGWDIVNQTMGLEKKPRWVAGGGNYRNRLSSAYPNWKQNVTYWSKIWQAQGFSVFFADANSDDGLWDFEEWLPAYYPLGYDFNPYTDPLTLTVSSPLNITYATQTIWINTSTSEKADITYSIDEGSNQTACNNCTSSINSTSLGEGLHNITVYVVDSNDTSDTVSITRWFTIDITKPSPQFVSPTPNNETITDNFAYFNITADETLTEALLELNGTNYTMFGSGINWYINKTGLSNGNYTFFIWAKDEVNWNTTETRWVYIDYSLSATQVWSIDSSSWSGNIETNRTTEDGGDHYIKLGEFADNFNDNDFSGWSVLSSNWVVENGVLKQIDSNNNNSHGDIEVDGSNIVDGNIIVDAYHNWSNSDWGIYARKTDSSSLYVFLYGNDYIKFRNAHSSAGDVELMVFTPTVSSWYQLRLNLTNDSYWAYKNETLIFNDTDTTHTSGGYGIHSWANAWFDNFRVVSSNSGNLTWTTVNTSANQVSFNATIPVGTNVSIWASNGSYQLVKEEASANTNYSLPNGFNGSIRLELKTNDTVLTPSIISLTASEGGDTTPPAISNVGSSSITDTSAIITWTTDEVSGSAVRYGTAPSEYTNVQGNATYVTSHNISITDLTPDTTYYYVVNSTDASGNSAQSTEYSFKTAVPGDTDSSGCVDDMELFGYIEKWKDEVVSDADLLTVIDLWANC